MDEEILYLKNSGRWPKEEVTPVSVPKVQVTNVEWNKAVGVLEKHDGRIDAANQAALDCADSLAALGQELGKGEDKEIESNKLWNGDTGISNTASGRYRSAKFNYDSQRIIVTDATIYQYLFWNGNTYLGKSTTYEHSFSGVTTIAVNYASGASPTFLKYVLSDSLFVKVLENTKNIARNTEFTKTNFANIDNIAGYVGYGDIDIESGKVWNGNNGSDVSMSGRYRSKKFTYNANKVVLSDGSVSQYLFWNGYTFLGNSSTYEHSFTNVTDIAINYASGASPTYLKYISANALSLRINSCESNIAVNTANITTNTANILKKANKRQYIFANVPTSDLMKSVNDAIIELYLSVYSEGHTYLNSVRKKQTVSGTVYNTVSVEVWNSDNTSHTQYAFSQNGNDYDFGDGVQLLPLKSGTTIRGYVLIDWSKITNGTGYGSHTQTNDTLLKECGNIDRCPTIKANVSVPTGTVTEEQLAAELASYLTTSDASNAYAPKGETSNAIAANTSAISAANQAIAEVEQDVEAIEQDLDTINDALSGLSGELPSGAITGNNTWTGSNTFTQPIIGISGTNDNNVALYGQFKNTLHRNVDVADYGADPSATASENVTAINAALSGGNKTVTITKPGTYLLNGTLLVDDNTEFICSKGVVLKKAAVYSYVIMNSGASTRTTNYNITLRGVYIDCDNKTNGSVPLSSPLYGSRGHLNLFHVNNVRIYDITIINAALNAIQLCTFYNVLIDGFYISADGGDGIHINRGEHLIVRNGIVSSWDDACPLNASDWLGSCPEVGSIHDCHFENIIELDRSGATGNFARHLVGKWVDWYSGMEIVHGDKVVSNGHVYRAYTANSVDTFTSTTEPDCTAEEGSQEDAGGFTWRYVNDDAVYEADIWNITYRNIHSLINRNFINCYYESGTVSSNKIWDRSVYPTIQQEDYPFVRNVVIDNVEKESGRILYVKSYIKSQYLIQNMLSSPTSLALVNVTTSGHLCVRNVDFSNGGQIVTYSNVQLYVKDCIGSPTITPYGKIIADCNVSSLPSQNVKGSMVMHGDVPYYNDGTGWSSMV